MDCEKLAEKLLTAYDKHIKKGTDIGIKSVFVEVIKEHLTRMITHIKYFNESKTINVTYPRNPGERLPVIQDILSFGSPRRYMVIKVEQRDTTLCVWLGTP